MIATLDSVMIRALDPQTTALVHGTSVETAIHLLQRGKLVIERFCEHPRPYTKDQFYFSPNPLLAQGPWFRDDETPNWFTWETAKNQSAIYARMNARLHFLAVHLGYYSPQFNDLNYSAESGPIEVESYTNEPSARKAIRRQLVRQFQKSGYSRNSTYQLLEQASERKGVLIGFGSAALTKPIARDPEQYGSVYMHAPNGIENTLISGIEPFGDIERNMLLHYQATFLNKHPRTPL